MAPASQPVMPPPQLRDYTFVRHLASGGYSEVFEYRATRLERPVAVKVLTEETADSEAKLMATVSRHPSIVDVYDTGVTDDGHRYLVMRLFHGNSYAEIIRSSGPLPVDEVLRVGILMAGAIQFAHDHGILHRDIKPANILTDDVHDPALTDFGIAGQRDSHDQLKAASLPWAPPEVLEESPSDTRSDVYSLAATLYTMLAGRAPFYREGEDNSEKAVLGRTMTMAVPSLSRRAVPRSLEALRARAMSKDPAVRPEQAADFGWALQAIEAEMGFQKTRLVLQQEPSAPTADRASTDDDATTVRIPRVIRSDSDDRTRDLPGLIRNVPIPGGTAGTSGPAFDLPAVGRADARANANRPAQAPARTHRRVAYPLAIGLIMAALAIGWMTRQSDSPPPPTTTEPKPCDQVGGCRTTLPPGFLPAPENVTVTRTEGGLKVEWGESDDADQYLVGVCDDAMSSNDVIVERATSVEIPWTGGDDGACVRVTAASGSRRSEPTEARAR